MHGEEHGQKLQAKEKNGQEERFRSMLEHEATGAHLPKKRRKGQRGELDRLTEKRHYPSPGAMGFLVAASDHGNQKKERGKKGSEKTAFQKRPQASNLTKKQKRPISF